MKKFISLVLVVMLICAISVTSNADLTSSSPNTYDLFFPSTFPSYFKVCNSNGGLSRYISSADFICEKIDSFDEYKDIENLIYAFRVSSNYELKDGEYIEFPIYFETANEDVMLKAEIYETHHAMPLYPMVDNYWMINITEYGTLIVSALA